MINKNNYKEYIDDFLTGKLDPESHEAFQELVGKDTGIASEVRFQEQTIHSLQAYRKGMLKSRLQNISVELVGQRSKVWQAAATASMGIILGLGAFFYISHSDNMKTLYERQSLSANQNVSEKHDPADEHAEFAGKKQQPARQQRGSVKELAKKEAQASEEKRNVTSSSTSKHSARPADKKDVTENIAGSEKPESTEKKSSSSKAAKREKPDIVHKFEVSDSPKTGKGELPSHDIAASADNTKENLEVENKKSEKYDHHYKYYNSKLFLYGDFGSSRYEILEFNDTEGKKLYLYYNDQFYILEDDQFEVTSLEPVTDTTLIRKLKKARKN